MNLAPHRAEDVMIGEPVQTQKWLKLFFEEKALQSRLYEVQAADGVHLIGTETVIELIHQAPPNEQLTVMNVLTQIDFHNGNVHHFLNHLAACYVRTMAAFD